MANERLQVSTSGKVTIARFRDQKILDEANIQQLGTELTRLATHADVTKLLLNFEQVEFLSSAALGKLMAVKKKADQNQVELRLCSIRPEIFEVFKITQFDEYFNISDDQEEALEAFGE